MREDRRAILRADIIALPVELGRVMRCEEHIEQVAIADLILVEGQPDCLGMTRVSAADLLVGRVRYGTADIAAFDLLDADHVLEYRLGAPETSACQSRDFACHPVLLLCRLK